MEINSEPVLDYSYTILIKCGVEKLRTILHLSIATSNLTDATADVTVERDQGEPLIFSCTARGYPRPIITWSPGSGGSRMINTSTSTDAEGYLAITSNLIIPNVVRVDARIYTCTANSTEGMDTRSFNLTVYCKFAFF